jgi:hypothetical protein
MDFLKDEKSKLIVYGLIVIVVVYMLYKITDKMSNWSIFGGKTEGEKANIDASKKVIAAIKTDNRLLTYKPIAYVEYANAVYKALNTAWYAMADDEAIRNVMRAMRSKTDYLEMKKQYGVRDGLTLDEALKKQYPRRTVVGLSINDINEILRKSYKPKVKTSTNTPYQIP